MDRPDYKTTCPSCGEEHTIKPNPDPDIDGYENKACSCGAFLEFYELGLSSVRAKWVTVEGFESEAKLEMAK